MQNNFIRINPVFLFKEIRGFVLLQSPCGERVATPQRWIPNGSRKLCFNHLAVNNTIPHSTLHIPHSKSLAVSGLQRLRVGDEDLRYMFQSPRGERVATVVYQLAEPQEMFQSPCGEQHNSTFHSPHSTLKKPCGERVATLKVSFSPTEMTFQSPCGERVATYET